MGLAQAASSAVCPGRTRSAHWFCELSCIYKCVGLDGVTRYSNNRPFVVLVPCNIYGRISHHVQHHARSRVSSISAFSMARLVLLGRLTSLRRSSCKRNAMLRRTLIRKVIWLSRAATKPFATVTFCRRLAATLTWFWFASDSYPTLATSLSWAVQDVVGVRIQRKTIEHIEMFIATKAGA
jgi:hypothetical protein